MAKIIEYNWATTVAEVNDMIAEGWQPFGSISYTPGNLSAFSGSAFRQPMVKYEEHKTEKQHGVCIECKCTTWRIDQKYCAFCAMRLGVGRK